MGKRQTRRSRVKQLVDSQAKYARERSRAKYANPLDLRALYPRERINTDLLTRKYVDDRGQGKIPHYTSFTKTEPRIKEQNLDTAQDDLVQRTPQDYFPYNPQYGQCIPPTEEGGCWWVKRGVWIGEKPIKLPLWNAIQLREDGFFD